MSGNNKQTEKGLQPRPRGCRGKEIKETTGDIIEAASSDSNKTLIVPCWNLVDDTWHECGSLYNCDKCIDFNYYY